MAKAAGYSASEHELIDLGESHGRSIYQRMTAALMLPREHGAWAMLLMPYLLGTIEARQAGRPSLLLLVAILLLFTASRPIELAIQGGRARAVIRLLAYGIAGGAAGLALLLLYDRWMLLPLAAGAGLLLGPQLLLRRRRLERTWPARIASIAALSATGPAAYYAATGTLDTRALAIWTMAFLYSGASVFYVRLFYRTPGRHKREPAQLSRLRAERQMIMYLAVAIAIVALLATVGFVSPVALVALLPLALKAALGCRRRDSRPTLRQIGFAELAHTTVFLALASITMRLA